MSDPIRFYFDFVDPGSYLLHLQLNELEEPDGVLDFIGMELALPPQEVIDPRAPEWVSYCDEVDRLALEADHTIPRPGFVPWSRKAHELLLHATHLNTAGPLRSALFRAHFEEGLDLGRIDVLAGVAGGVGLDRSEAKAVLDVDKYSQELVQQRSRALHEGIVRIPTIVKGTESLVGPTAMNDLRCLFESPGETTTGT